MKRDRFQTAGRIAEAMEHDAPRAADLRPLTPAEVREREFQEVKGKREFQRYVVDRYVWLALARILWPAEYGKPGTLDANILVVMDDSDIRDWVGRGENVDRLILFRNNLRRRMPS